MRRQLSGLTILVPLAVLCLSHTVAWSQQEKTEPKSNNASNLPGSVPHSDIAPQLPAPPAGEGAAPVAYLKLAAQSLAAGRTGEAQEAMERAETRALDRSVRPSQANVPDQQPLVLQINAALAALAAGNRGETLRLLQAAIRDAESATGPK